MTGRGVDQVLPFPSDPRLYEPEVKSALKYVELTEQASGRIPRHVAFDYIWGDALTVLERAAPDGRIVNLETAVTTNSHACPEKGIHYRMHPANIACLNSARIDCCVLANNHVLDWGRAGLEETLKTLHAAGIGTAGAGADDRSASSPAVIDVRTGVRVLVYAVAVPSSGVPRDWRATAEVSGVNWLPGLTQPRAEKLIERIAADRRAADRVVVSIHWGGNWGYEVSREEREFAHRLIDAGVVDVVHGHSSHHPKGIEVYRHKLILYGCGDFLNDYEGIGGYESFRPDLTVMYFAGIDADSGELRRLILVPMRIHRFQVRHAPEEASEWLARRLDSVCRQWNTKVEHQADGTLSLGWEPGWHP